MESQQSHNKLHVVFLPYPAIGHMNPMIDTARLFAKHGVNVTIILTHANASRFQKSIDSDVSLGYSIKTQLLQFPSAQVGLPEGIENMNDATSREMLSKVTRGVWMLKDSFEVLFKDLQPDCIVTDMMYPWTKFTIPCLPHTVEMTRLQLCDWERETNVMTAIFEPNYVSAERSYGSLYNSFHELESDYENLSKTTIGIKSWSVGPVSAWANKDDKRKANRGHTEKSIGKQTELLNWLNLKQNESVLYVSFGSQTRFPHAQLVEIAHGLENSGHNFIWVIKKDDKVEDGEGFLQEFEERMKESNKGYIIWDWAPQLLILDHPATRGIVTHCGWNSILESLNSGLPMITWPVSSEQFYNEKLLVDVLKIGVPAGAKVNKFWMNITVDEMVRREEITKAVEILMGSGQESKEMRMRAKKLGDAAKRTIEEGGDSYNNLIQLIDELKSLKKSKTLDEKAD
ncbi:putative soyasapogenol B glucuronide galactosyltransferase [Medicago truncatula]|uniref:Putative soyasapogenol B glucuronide galactosyltransferase n=1 Tax=Medicago truncatula TaxID=3880 RepID=A0A396H006_MEDTR|nr:putative soyasapogenol B glucuronide galactosyltransferase [Medicago truncatula]